MGQRDPVGAKRDRVRSQAPGCWQNRESAGRYSGKAYLSGVGKEANETDNGGALHVNTEGHSTGGAQATTALVDKGVETVTEDTGSSGSTYII